MKEGKTVRFDSRNVHSSRHTYICQSIVETVPSIHPPSVASHRPTVSSLEPTVHPQYERLTVIPYPCDERLGMPKEAFEVSPPGEEDAEPDAEPGALAKAQAVWTKVSNSYCYHILQALLSLLSMAVMINALSVLDKPPHFYPEVHQAMSLNAGVPASNGLFDPLAAASKKEEMKGTLYRYAFANGKSAVRVCTDFTQDEFEAITGLKPEQRTWDDMDYQAIADFYKNGCANTSTLAYNSACSSEGAYYWRAYNPLVTALVDEQSKENFPRRGACGEPGVSKNKLFVKPNPGLGWLWTMMIRPDIIPQEFGPDFNETTKNCTTDVCQVGRLCYDNSCRNGDYKCEGFQRTDGCSWTKTEPKEGHCERFFPLHRDGYCDCGEGVRVHTCDVRRRVPTTMTEINCGEVCECQTNQTSCSGAGKTRCSCDVTTDLVKGKPDWITDNVEFENDKCIYGFGPINADKHIWRKTPVKACELTHVHAYGRQTLWIVALFYAAVLTRFFLFLSVFYWGCTEDDVRLKILFMSSTPMRIIAIFKYGLKELNDVLTYEHEEGWPWFIGLVDAFLTTVATFGVAYGADPFPEMTQGRFTLFLLWFAAAREVGKTLYTLKTSVQHKQWYVTRETKHVECCSRTIYWPFTNYSEETFADVKSP